MADSTPGLTSFVLIWLAMVLAMTVTFLLLWMPGDVVRKRGRAAKQVRAELVRRGFSVRCGALLNKSSLVHLLLFGCLACAFYLNLNLFQTLSLGWVIGLSLLVAGLLGILTEIGQILVKGRSYSIVDIGVDLAGAGLGIGVAYCLSRYWAH